MQKPQSLFFNYLLRAATLLLVVLGSCSPDNQPATESAQAPTAVQQSAPAAPAPSAEGLFVSPSHWINTDPIGDGEPAVSAELLTAVNTNPQQWLQYGGDFRNFRHSPIEQLSPENVENLRFAWGFPTGTMGQFAVSPVVYDGIMYITSSYNRLFALDARNGDLFWRYDHEQPADLRICCGPANRGVAIVGDKVLMATLDAHLLAFDRKSGEILWDTEIIEYNRGFSATSAPLIVKNMAIIGIAGGEFGVRGFFDAYDVDTGERVWRHYTVPAAGEPGAETWSGDSYQTGGAPAWTIGAYDPELDTLYWTTGNPSPDWNGDSRLGDNLYSDSVLAIEPDTGEMKWYFQFTPHDVWDYDGNTHLFLVDLAVEDETVKALVQANRNGFFYAINRETGEFIRATNYLEQLNWATSMEPSGRPIVNPEATPTEEPTMRVCPGVMGGMNGAVSGALNPDLGLVYIPVIESCQLLQKGIGVHVEGLQYTGGTPIPADALDASAYGHITAIDYQTGEVRWRFMDPEPMMAGTLSTAGGLVFTGSQTGHAIAIDGATGEELWRFKLGGGIRSQPIAYQIDDESYVAIGTGNFAGIASFVGANVEIPEGGHLYVFKLSN